MNVRNIATEAVNRSRKLEHLEISLNRSVEYPEITTGLENYRLTHRAIPEIDLEDVDLSVTFLGKRLSAPILISSMVGGVDEAGVINGNLARAAREYGLAMGVGSQRCALEDPACEASFKIRDLAPDIFLCANLGAVQLNYGFGADECLRAVEMIQADALILHLNPLQEAIQPEGNTRFSGLLKKIEGICRCMPVPVIIKEVCFGISEEAARDLANAGASCLDVAGAGGTSWSEVEAHRSPDRAWNSMARAFSSWGIPTAESIVLAGKGAPGLPLIASGGIRSGIDAAKALALGADLAGIALPLFKAACESAEAVSSVLFVITETLRRAMFCTGARTIEDLHRTKLITKEEK
ncbi:MAG TPA: type 2 isopentenyl-diphosphate Delta-isomerase [Spirochaetota bacterium]|nr:type 2 isopentenyl-diphosphate Delta-isomerase [Spirochaetota bacterium]HPI90357.1 type 2 isopentenyl-diphosphate Delta-isomerase [Spirochaetota bacterium]HPR48475.1 type 2 isopentenyl-diphosphate Delta-isomerase [Spirochaetota bacterium]